MATIKDVAKKAGLSVTTVSRFLNNHPYISDEKKQRIELAMQALDYVPNAIAVSLRANKTFTIGVLVSRITNPFFAYLVDTIEREAKSHGYTVFIVQTYDDSYAELSLLERLKQKQLDGLIMCSVESSPETLNYYHQFGTIVLCNESFPDVNIPQISTNQAEITYQAIRYLVQQGAKKIAYCTGGLFRGNSHGSSRNQGFKQAMAEANLPIFPELIFRQVHTIADGKQVATQLLTLPDADFPDAIFAGSDEVASGLISVFTQAKRSVPQNLRIIGFDNQPFAEMLSVPLTTIAQPVEALGQEAVRLLMANLNGKVYQVDQSRLNLTLVLRQSA